MNSVTAVAEFGSLPFSLDWSHYLILMRIENARFEIVSTDFAIVFKANYKYDYGNLDD